MGYNDTVAIKIKRPDTFHVKVILVVLCCCLSRSRLLQFTFRMEEGKQKIAKHHQLKFRIPFGVKDCDHGGGVADGSSALLPLCVDRALSFRLL